MAEDAGGAGQSAARAVAEKIMELLPEVNAAGHGAQTIRDLAESYARLYRPSAQGITLNVEKK
jgi:hypothetical protein